MIARNVKSASFLSQHAAKAMIAAGRAGGLSISARRLGWSLCRASRLLPAKAAVLHMTRCLAVEWGRYGITVNAVAPTFIATPGTEAALSDPAFRADTLERDRGPAPDRRADEVAAGVLFLARRRHRSSPGTRW